MQDFTASPDGSISVQAPSIALVVNADGSITQTLTPAASVTTITKAQLQSNITAIQAQISALQALLAQLQTAVTVTPT